MNDARTLVGGNLVPEDDSVVDAPLAGKVGKHRLVTLAGKIRSLKLRKDLPAVFMKLLEI